MMQTEQKDWTVQFAPEALHSLEELAERKGKSLLETLRDAIGHEQWLLDIIDSGGRIIIERDGERREVVRL